MTQCLTETLWVTYGLSKVEDPASHGKLVAGALVLSSHLYENWYLKHHVENGVGGALWLLWAYNWPQTQLPCCDWTASQAPHAADQWGVAHWMQPESADRIQIWLGLPSGLGKKPARFAGHTKRNQNTNIRPLIIDSSDLFSNEGFCFIMFLTRNYLCRLSASNVMLVNMITRAFGYAVARQCRVRR